VNNPTNTSTDTNIKGTNDNDGIAKKYWPCAPDGFIPNSIIRYLIRPKQEELNEVKPWKPKEFNRVDNEPEMELYTPDFSDESILKFLNNFVQYYT
jgi:hypothetical protein